MQRSLALAGLALVLAGCASPGIEAARNHDAVTLQKILDQPNHGNEDIDGLMAYSWDCPDCVRELLQAGAKGTDEAAAVAAFEGKTEMARLFIEKGADIPGTILAVRGFAQNSGDNSQRIAAAIEWLHATYPNPEAKAPTALSGNVDESEVSLGARLTPVFHETERPDDYALIVGIEKYDALPAATFADRDAAAAGDFVEAMGVPASNVVMLTDSHATRSGLAKKLEGWLANNVNENSTVYFYYSGHGAPDAATGQAYLVPFDGDPEYLDQTGYPLQRLYAKLAALKAKRVIVMLDSCFSGAGGRSVLPHGARPLVSKVNMTIGSSAGKISVLAAAGPEQISGIIDGRGHGLFSYYLFSGLNGGAKDASGRVTVKSLYDFLRPKVAADAHRENRDQVPQLQSGGEDPTRLVLRGK